MPAYTGKCLRGTDESRYGGTMAMAAPPQGTMGSTMPPQGTMGRTMPTYNNHSQNGVPRRPGRQNAYNEYGITTAIQAPVVGKAIRM